MPEDLRNYVSRQPIKFGETLDLGIEGLITQIQDNIIHPIQTTVSKIKVTKVSNEQQPTLPPDRTGISGTVTPPPIPENIEPSTHSASPESNLPADEQNPPEDHNLNHPPPRTPRQGSDNPLSERPFKPPPVYIDSLPPPPDFPRIPEGLLPGNPPLHDEGSPSLDEGLFPSTHEVSEERKPHEFTPEETPSPQVPSFRNRLDRISNFSEESPMNSAQKENLPHVNLVQEEPVPSLLALSPSSEELQSAKEGQTIESQLTSGIPTPQQNTQGNQGIENNMPLNPFINRPQNNKEEDQEIESKNLLNLQSLADPIQQDMENPFQRPITGHETASSGQDHETSSPGQNSQSQSPTVLSSQQTVSSQTSSPIEIPEEESQSPPPDFLNPLSPKPLHLEAEQIIPVLLNSSQNSVRTYLQTKHDQFNINLEKLFSGHNIIEGDVTQGSLHLSLSFESWILYGQKIAQSFPYGIEIRLSYVINCLNSALKMNLDCLNRSFGESFDFHNLQAYYQTIDETLLTLGQQLEIAETNINTEALNTHKVTYFLSQTKQFIEALKSYNQVLEDILEKAAETDPSLIPQSQDTNLNSEPETPVEQERDLSSETSDLPGKVTVDQGLSTLYQSDFKAMKKTASTMYEMHTQSSHQLYNLLTIIYEEGQKTFGGLTEGETHTSLRSLKDNLAFLTNEFRTKKPVIGFLERQLKIFFAEHQSNEESAVLSAIRSEEADEQIPREESYITDNLRTYIGEVEQAEDVLLLLPDAL